MSEGDPVALSDSAAPSDPAAPRAPTSVAIVEDQPALLHNLVKLLGEFPQVAVHSCYPTGEAAVEGLLANRPQAVLLDLELPGMDGIEVIRAVKPKAPELVILVLTTFDDEAKVYEAVTAGASGYLVKRIPVERIVAGIAEAMDGGFVVEAAIGRRFWNYFQSLRRPLALQDPFGLTPEERRVLAVVAKGLSNSEISTVLALERRTVRTHLLHIYKKLGVDSHVEAVVKALKAGLVEP
jgi:DNA-binding NarL/FixJ family response regulator